MRIVHLCIDLQHGESGYFQDDEWEKLVKNAFTLKRRLSGVGVPTIHVGYIDTRTSKYVEATMGRMDDVCYELIKSDPFKNLTLTYDFESAIARSKHQSLVLA